MEKEAARSRAEKLARFDDPKLIAECLKGKEDAWEALITRYQRLIYSIPIKTRLSSDDAADVFQSVIVKLLENLANLRNHEKIASWLITTTTRECWRLSARQRRTDSLDNEVEEDGIGQTIEIVDRDLLADEQLIGLQRQQTVRQGIATLPERCRNLLLMLFYQKDELSYEDIARQLKIPVPSIGPTRARCLEKLKKLIADKL